MCNGVNRKIHEVRLAHSTFSTLNFSHRADSEPALNMIAARRRFPQNGELHSMFSSLMCENIETETDNNKL